MATKKKSEKKPAAPPQFGEPPLEPTVSEGDVDRIRRKFKDRGFVKDGKNERCNDCGQYGLALYRLLHSKLGGRDIEWCMACGRARSWRRSADDKRIEDVPFDLEEFLS